jgi:hypothetical protein
MKITWVLILIFMIFGVEQLASSERFEEKLGPFALSFESSDVMGVDISPVEHMENIVGVDIASYTIHLYNTSTFNTLDYATKTNQAFLGLITIAQYSQGMGPDDRNNSCRDGKCVRVDPSTLCADDFSCPPQLIDGHRGDVVYSHPRNERDGYAFYYWLNQYVYVIGHSLLPWNGTREILDTIHVEQIGSSNQV